MKNSRSAGLVLFLAVAALPCHGEKGPSDAAKAGLRGPVKAMEESRAVYADQGLCGSREYGMPSEALKRAFRYFP